MLTVQSFAEEKKISKPVLDTWIYRHGLPVVRIGRRNYIDERDYDDWIAAHKQVVAAKPKERSTQIALPKQCRKSGILAKLHRVY
jgi:hypothetical protein